MQNYRNCHVNGDRFNVFKAVGPLIFTEMSNDVFYFLCDATDFRGANNVSLFADDDQTPNLFQKYIY